MKKLFILLGILPFIQITEGLGCSNPPKFGNSFEISYMENSDSMSVIKGIIKEEKAFHIKGPYGGNIVAGRVEVLENLYGRAVKSDDWVWITTTSDPNQFSSSWEMRGKIGKPLLLILHHYKNNQEPKIRYKFEYCFWNYSEIKTDSNGDEILSGWLEDQFKNKPISEFIKFMNDTIQKIGVGNNHIGKGLKLTCELTYIPWVISSNTTWKKHQGFNYFKDGGLNLDWTFDTDLRNGVIHQYNIQFKAEPENRLYDQRIIRFYANVNNSNGKTVVSRAFENKVGQSIFGTISDIEYTASFPLPNGEKVEFECIQKWAP